MQSFRAVDCIEITFLVKSQIIISKFFCFQEELLINLVIEQMINDSDPGML